MVGCSGRQNVMNTFFQFLKSLVPTIESQQDRDEAYLSEAEDICDLERRMHEIDERGRDGHAALIVGLEGR